ncbi:MAG: hypothetical protein U5Q44_06985 [Dehalococcoidia bacterium]|nr:hypothetical protein [Dehalococcoidia bacterium]
MKDRRSHRRRGEHGAGAALDLAGGPHGDEQGVVVADVASWWLSSMHWPSPVPRPCRGRGQRAEGCVGASVVASLVALEGQGSRSGSPQK